MRLKPLMMCLAIALASISCKNNEAGDYLVRETDRIVFSSAAAQSKQITLRCMGYWKTVVPKGAEWVSTEPSEGTGTGEMEWISVNVTANRGEERSATIYLENGGERYPIEVTQSGGAIVWGVPVLSGTLVQGTECEASISIPYSNAIGDETVFVTCNLSGDCEGIEVQPFSADLELESGMVTVTVGGTPASSGTAEFELLVDGTSVGSVKATVYGKTEPVLSGLPVQWKFSDVKGTADDRDALRENKPEWLDGDHIIIADDGARAEISIVEADGKNASAVSGWNYNDGHAYVKGLYVDDYWLFAVPVENLGSGTAVRIEGSIGGSGSSAAFFLMEYSCDGQSWTALDGATETSVTINEAAQTVKYHAQAFDDMNASKGAFTADFTVPQDIETGTLYVRARVCANVRITLNNTITTGGGGSTRLKGTWKISVVE